MCWTAGMTGLIRSSRTYNSILITSFDFGSIPATQREVSVPQSRNALIVKKIQTTDTGVVVFVQFKHTVDHLLGLYDVHLSEERAKLDYFEYFEPVEPSQFVEQFTAGSFFSNTNMFFCCYKKKDHPQLSVQICQRSLNSEGKYLFVKASTQQLLLDERTNSTHHGRSLESYTSTEALQLSPNFIPYYNTTALICQSLFGWVQVWLYHRKEFVSLSKGRGISLRGRVMLMDNWETDNMGVYSVKRISNHRYSLQRMFIC